MQRPCEGHCYYRILVIANFHFCSTSSRRNCKKPKLCMHWTKTFNLFYPLAQFSFGRLLLYKCLFVYSSTKHYACCFQTRNLLKVALMGIWICYDLWDKVQSLRGNIRVCQNTFAPLPFSLQPLDRCPNFICSSYMSQTPTNLDPLDQPLPTKQWPLVNSYCVNLKS